jgi:hypothetical protein
MLLFEPPYFVSICAQIETMAGSFWLHLRPPQVLVRLAQPLADVLHLPVLPQHIHVVLFFLAFYTILFSHISPFLSTYFFPTSYPGSPAYTAPVTPPGKHSNSNGNGGANTFQGLARKQRTSKLHWDVALVSLVQSSVVSVLVLFDPARSHRTWQGRIWGCNDNHILGMGAAGLEGTIGAVAMGYFAWHFVAMIFYREVFGWPLVAHGVVALFVGGVAFVSIVISHLRTVTFPPGFYSDCVFFFVFFFFFFSSFFFTYSSTFVHVQFNNGRQGCEKLHRFTNTPLPLSQRPFVPHYLSIYLLYELSNPFLDIHRFLSWTGHAGGVLESINGIALLVVFTLCRPVWGTYQMYWMLSDELNALHVSRAWTTAGRVGGRGDLFDPGPLSTADAASGLELERYAPAAAPLWLVSMHLLSGVVLLGLNYWWFGLIVKKAARAFMREGGRGKGR